MTKKLDTTTIQNELRGASVFFQSKPPVPDVTSEQPLPSADALTDEKVLQEENDKKETKLASESDIMTSRYQDPVIEKIRKCVKVIGKETTPLRMTPAEKEQLSDIVYSFKKKGVRTSENEINRIASSFLINDYKQNKEKSILTRVLEALNS